MTEAMGMRKKLQAAERERSTPTEPDLLRACEEVVARYDGPGTAFEAFQSLRNLFPGSADFERLEREVQDLRATTTGPAWDKYHNAVTRAEKAERERDEARAQVHRFQTGKEVESDYLTQLDEATLETLALKDALETIIAEAQPLRGANSVDTSILLRDRIVKLGKRAREALVEFQEKFETESFDKVETEFAKENPE